MRERRPPQSNQPSQDRAETEEAQGDDRVQLMRMHVRRKQQSDGATVVHRAANPTAQAASDAMKDLRAKKDLKKQSILDGVSSIGNLNTSFQGAQDDKQKSQMKDAAKDRYEQTDTGIDKDRGFFVSEMMELQNTWDDPGEKPPGVQRNKGAERTEVIATAVNDSLQTVGLPSAAKVDIRPQPGLAPEAGQFAPPTWQLDLSEPFLNNDQKPDDKQMAAFVNTTFHEARHAEQIYRRDMVVGEEILKDSQTQQNLGLSGPPASEAELAKALAGSNMDPAARPDVQAMFAKQLWTRHGAGEKNLSGTDGVAKGELGEMMPGFNVQHSMEYANVQLAIESVEELLKDARQVKTMESLLTPTDQQGLNAMIAQLEKRYEQLIEGYKSTMDEVDAYATGDVAEREFLKKREKP